MPLTINGENGIVYNNLNADIKNLLMPKNWIINGMFDVWQRGTNIVNTINAETYSIDRFNTFLVGGTTSTTSQQAFAVGQIDVPNNPKFFSRHVVVSGGLATSRCMFQQKIEDISKLSGKTVSVSFWIKADANKNVSIELTQDFGVGGSSPIVGIGVQKFSISTVWQRLTKTIVVPSVAGKTLGDKSHLKLVVWFDAGSDHNARTDSLGNQSGTFDIANISLVEGSVAVECQNQPYADVFRECRRYVKKYDGTSTHQTAFGFAYSTTNFLCILSPQDMRTANPAIEYSNVHVSDAITARAVTSLFVWNPNNDNIGLQASVSSGLTAFRPCYLEIQSGGYIILSAEL